MSIDRSLGPIRLPEHARGFTILEILVALAIGGLVAIGARELFAVTSDGALQISAAARALDSTANRDRLLNSLVANIEATGDSINVFGGDSAQVQFTSWCATAFGWTERCRVTLQIEATPISGVIARFAGGSGIPLMATKGAAEFRYLTDASAGGMWSNRWSPGPLVPRAIAVTTRDDTLLLRIGDRG